jgi:hypothetical protein
MTDVRLMSSQRRQFSARLRATEDASYGRRLLALLALVLLCDFRVRGQSRIGRNRAMPSWSKNSRAASRRSQSQMRRWISGSGRRRRSGRGGKRPAWPATSPRLLPLLELVPDQEAVRQHHADRVPVEARP